ncbi:sodium:calcium antiporter [Piscicoccus intestinalis]|uniref:sodium:calcium antiporter n=1 Tax=Piscicoccus intestinalis TaxID=746033 RepID=UPI0008383213|nr:hypothetical protein [Piscicoccus intestinalis]
MTLLGVLAPGLGLLVLGCVLLTWGADVFMEHLAKVARIVGLPMVAMALLLAGAEPEEMATAVIASAQGRPVLAATDALGANVTMLTLGLGLGLALLVQPVAVRARLRRYAGFAALTGVAAAAAVADGVVQRWEGALLCALFVAVVAFIWRTERRPPAFGELAETDDDDDDDDIAGSAVSGRRAVVWLLAGLFAMVLGGALAVDGAGRIAVAAGLGEHATGLTALAFATSAEVLALVVAARRRRLTQVAIGGVLGSALYNSTLTLGVASLVAPLEAPGLLTVAVVAAALPLAVFAAVRGRLPAVVGGVLAAGYVAYVVAVLRGVL